MNDRPKVIKILSHLQSGTMDVVRLEDYENAIQPRDSEIAALRAEVKRLEKESGRMRAFIKRYTEEAEASGGWNGDDDLFDTAMSILSLPLETNSVEPTKCSRSPST